MSTVSGLCISPRLDRTMSSPVRSSGEQQRGVVTRGVARTASVGSRPRTRASTRDTRVERSPTQLTLAHHVEQPLAHGVAGTVEIPPKGHGKKRSSRRAAGRGVRVPSPTFDRSAPIMVSSEAAIPTPPPLFLPPAPIVRLRHSSYLAAAKDFAQARASEVDPVVVGPGVPSDHSDEEVEWSDAETGPTASLKEEEEVEEEEEEGVVVPPAKGRKSAGFAAGLDLKGKGPSSPPSDSGEKTVRVGTEISDDLTATVRSIMDGLSWEQQCRVVGIHPTAATRGVTAAGPGGAIVRVVEAPHRRVPVVDRRIRKKSLVSRPTAVPSLTSDELFARALQAEENEAADRIAETLAADEKLALELSESDSSPVSHTSSPRSVHAPPSPLNSPGVLLPANSSRAVFAHDNRYDVLSYEQGKQTSDRIVLKNPAQRQLFVDRRDQRSAELEKSVLELERTVEAVRTKTYAQRQSDLDKAAECRRRTEAEERRRVELSNALHASDRALADHNIRTKARRKADQEEADRDAVETRKMEAGLKERELALRRKVEKHKRDLEMRRRRAEHGGATVLSSTAAAAASAASAAATSAGASAAAAASVASAAAPTAAASVAAPASATAPAPTTAVLTAVGKDDLQTAVRLVHIQRELKARFPELDCEERLQLAESSLRAQLAAAPTTGPTQVLAPAFNPVPAPIQAPMPVFAPVPGGMGGPAVPENRVGNFMGGQGMHPGGISGRPQGHHGPGLHEQRGNFGRSHGHHSHRGQPSSRGGGRQHPNKRYDGEEGMRLSSDDEEVVWVEQPRRATSSLLTAPASNQAVAAPAIPLVAPVAAPAVPIAPPAVAPAVAVPAVAPAVAVTAVAPVVQPVPNPLIDDVPSPRRRAEIGRLYARFDTRVLMPVPLIPFTHDHNGTDLVHFTTAINDAVISLRVACEDSHPVLWTPGWEMCLQRHILRSIRTNAPQVSDVRSLVTQAFKDGIRLQKEGQIGPDVLQYIVRTLCRGLSKSTPAAVMQALQNLVVPAGTPFSKYVTELKLLLANVRSVGHVAPEDGTLQIAIKTGVDDQFAVLGAQIFSGRNMTAVPYSSVDGLMGALEDLSLNQTMATASARMTGGMTTRSKSYNQAFRSRQFGGVMKVEVDPFEDEAEEIGQVHAVLQERGGFGRNNKDPPFYVQFDTRENRDAARRSYGPRCMNCGHENHFARECPEKFLNRSNLIHPAVGDGTPQEAEARWRRWQKRLCQWALARAQRNAKSS